MGPVELYHGSELQGQETACMCILGLHNHYSELFTYTAGIKFAAWPPFWTNITQYKR